jgi:hypothetical protein
MVDMGEMHLEHQRVVLGEAALQGEAQLGDLGPHAGAGHRRWPFWLTQTWLTNPGKAWFQESVLGPIPRLGLPSLAMNAR